MFQLGLLQGLLLEFQLQLLLKWQLVFLLWLLQGCLLYTSPSPRD